MFLDNELDAFVERLKANEQLREVKIIRAYPYVDKPTILKDVVITVSPAEIKGESISIGQDNLLTSYTIDADIYVPVSLGSPEMWKYIQLVLSSQPDSSPIAVAVSEVKADNRLACYTAKCSLTYNSGLKA